MPLDREFTSRRCSPQTQLTDLQFWIVERHSLLLAELSWELRKWMCDRTSNALKQNGQMRPTTLWCNGRLCVSTTKQTPRIPHQARNYDILNRRRCYGVTTTMPTPLLLTSQAKMPQSRTKIRIGINTLLVVANRSPGLWAIREFISFPEMRSVRVLTNTTARHAGSFENRLFRVTFGASRRESLIAQRWSL